MTSKHRKIAIVTFGTRGDVQPFCVLARALNAAGLDATIITSDEHLRLVRSYGIPVLSVGVNFIEIIPSLDIAKVIRFFGRDRSKRHEFESLLLNVFMCVLVFLRRFDVLIYHPFAFFAGMMARELLIPAMRVTLQPLLPSYRQPVSLMGADSLGPLRNRLSYEVFRVASLLTHRVHSRFRTITGVGRRLNARLNPLTIDGRSTPQLQAFSPHLSPAAGDWMGDVTTTGFWFDEPMPGEALPEAVSAFLESGAPPLYVGFGLMPWNDERVARTILGGVEQWGGRAILSVGNGGPCVPQEAPPNILVVRSVSHALLFRRVAGAAHHGGAGTTAMALRNGLPSQILPLIGDQPFWGAQVHRLGAGPPPVPVRDLTADRFAAMLRALTEDAGYGEAARRAAGVLAAEPGVAAAVARIESFMASSRIYW